MKIAGANTIPFPVARVWDALLDPQVLVATIPGCERLEATGDHTYAMTVTAGVAAIKGTYSGTCALSDLEEHTSLVMRLQGAGAPGTVDATVDVSFAEVEPGVTQVSWAADAVVGGMVGGVGQRMLGSVSKRMAGEFFDNVGSVIGQPAGVAAAGAGPAGAPASGGGGTGGSSLAAPAGQVFTAPSRPGGISAHDDFLKGVALGAGLVLAGVIVGGIFGRRR